MRPPEGFRGGGASVPIGHTGPVPQSTYFFGGCFCFVLLMFVKILAASTVCASFVLLIFIKIIAAWTDGLCCVNNGDDNAILSSY